MAKKIRLGDLLVENKIISEKQLFEALETQTKTKKRLGTIFIENGFVGEEQLAAFLGKQLDIDYRDLSLADIDFEIAKLIPENIARRYGVLPINKVNGTIYIAMVDPLDRIAIQEVKFLLNTPVKPIIVANRDLKKLLEGVYNSSSVSDAANEYLNNLDELSEIERGNLDINSAPIVKLINSIFDSAVSINASDIHIEAEQDKMKVRLRIDGFLKEILNTSIKVHNSVVNRIKILAGMNISEKRVPQDGRILHDAYGYAIDMRVSTMPTKHGEKVVIRLLNRENFLVDKRKLGLNQEESEIFDELVKKPYGIITVTGPTGSGKTTTLYSMLNELDYESQNIITLEDPIEFDMKGINQTQVNQEAGLVFSTGLRAILRQDPDIIMLGEIRDKETAEIAVRAALTGHLVLTTIHTNDAAGTISRMLDMGIEPFLLSSSLVGVVAQRLVRKICPKCKTGYEANEEEKKILGFPIEESLTLYKGLGCNNCMGTGYKGRIGVFEILKIDQEIKNMIDDRQNSEMIKGKAIENGFKTIFEDAKVKVISGETTVSELLRVTYTN